MRFSLCVVFLALCLAAWECTADNVGSDGQQLQSGAGGTSETAAPKTSSKDTDDQQIDLQREVQNDVIVDGDASEEQDHKNGEEDRRGDPQEKPQGGANLSQNEVAKTTTTTTTNNAPLDAVQITPPEHKAAGTDDNGLKGPEPPTTENTNNKVVKDTTKTPDPLPAPTAEGQTSSSNGQQAARPTPPKTTRAAPSDEDKPQRQILSAPSVKDKETSTHKDQRNSNTIQQPLQPKPHQEPQPPPQTQEKPQEPATPPASTKHKGVTNGTTTSATAPATADKNPVPPATPKIISTTAQGSAASTTAITSGDKEIDPTQTSISSTLELAKRDITHPANHSQTISKALQSLDNKDSSSHSSSLITLAGLTTVVLMAVVSAS